ncbi:MAG: hypothetical protein ACSHWY_11690 [Octadecabacter sp.]
MRNTIAIAALTVLGACAITDEQVNTAFDNFDAKARQATDESYRDLPFDGGVVYVVANEHGDLHTYSLTPCGDETRICGEDGRAGRVERTTDFYVVTGAYRDRTFYLSPGGDGYLTWRGVELDLAWN